MFTDRYHARPIRSPKQARHCIGYVLGNARKHAAEQGRVLVRDWVDPFSSAPTFEGWNRRTVTSADSTRAGVTLPAEFWVLRAGWRRHGLLDPNAIPGPAG